MTLASQQTAGRRRPDGWWYPYIFVGGFAVVLVVNLLLLYFATSTFNGLETRHAYEEGLHYNQRIAEQEAQEALGWTVELSVSGTSLPDGRSGRLATLSLMVRDRDGAPVSGLSVDGEIRRPVVAGHDRSVTLLPVDSGVYGATVELPLDGQWEVRLVAVGGGATYRRTERIVLR